MTWFYNSYSGKLVHEDAPAPGYYVYESALHSGTGWHELNVPGDASESDAAAAAKALGGSSPTTSNDVGTLGSNALSQGIAKTLGGPGEVLTAAFQQLTKPSMWRSLGWILLGGIATGLGVYWWSVSEGKTLARQVAKGKIDYVSAPVLPLALMGTGVYLMWFGVKYWEDVSVIWPSDPIKSILTNGTLPAHNADISASSLLNTNLGALPPSSSKSTSPTSSANGMDYVSEGSGSASQEQKYAFSQYGKYGWGSDQQQPLINLWNQESGWNPKAKNPTSGAYGIPQALPASKMASSGSDWLTNWKTQINWGLNYIKLRYGSPAAAWKHEQEYNWY